MMVGSSPTPGACCGPAHTYACVQSLHISKALCHHCSPMGGHHGFPPLLLTAALTHHPDATTQLLPSPGPSGHLNSTPTCSNTTLKATAYNIPPATWAPPSHQVGYTWRGGPGVRTGEGDRVPSAAAAAAAAITAAPKLEPSACGLNTSSGMSLRARAPVHAESSV